MCGERWVSLLWATITQMNCNRPCRVDPLRRESGTLIRSRLTGTRFLLTCHGWRTGPTSIVRGTLRVLTKSGRNGCAAVIALEFDRRTTAIPKKIRHATIEGLVARDENAARPCGDR